MPTCGRHFRLDGRLADPSYGNIGRLRQMKQITPESVNQSRSLSYLSALSFCAGPEDFSTGFVRAPSGRHALALPGLFEDDGLQFVGSTTAIEVGSTVGKRFRATLPGASMRQSMSWLLTAKTTHSWNLAWEQTRLSSKCPSTKAWLKPIKNLPATLPITFAYYNRARKHTGIGCQTADQFETKHAGRN